MLSEVLAVVPLSYEGGVMTRKKTKKKAEVLSLVHDPFYITAGHFPHPWGVLLDHYNSTGKIKPNRSDRLALLGSLWKFWYF